MNTFGDTIIPSVEICNLVVISQYVEKNSAKYAAS